MRINPTLRKRILKVLWDVRDVSQEQIGARCGKAGHKIWNLISSKKRQAPIEEGQFRETLAALDSRMAHAAATAAWLESLDALDLLPGWLTPAEADELEMDLLKSTERHRELLLELVALTRKMPPLDRYPLPGEVAALRQFARGQFERLAELKTADERLAVVRMVGRYQHWALMEIAAEESTKATSRSFEEAASWARLAVEIAGRVRGPEGWLNRVRGYAGAFGPNVLRVKGELVVASAALEEPKRLWHAGSDPDGVLDPGRLLDLEASLRRAQRKFETALALLDEARPITHHPARVLVNKGFTQEVMGEYEHAIEAYREAAPLAEKERDPRLSYMLRFNLAVAYTHPGRFVEALALLHEVREVVTSRGDENEIPRLTWLKGRIAAGMGRNDARSDLELALRQFADKGMHYDVALALLELSALLLKEGKTAEVKALTPKLADVFTSRKVHREALAALQLFQDAAEADAADEGLARRVLGFLFRARYDKGLKFES
ncbi:MAG: MalT-like region [Acidobacteriota bacterium]|jgi:tetratricopeptide (TPR) repeat protein|nr:MalT-like region [Acidobacteriota bacterium]